ncbi:MAG: fructokinase [Pseudohongiellaceae bacterium]|jgi:fructokinase
MHLGIDLGGTKIEIIAIDSNSTTLLRERCPTPQGDYQKTLGAICQMVDEAEQKLQLTGYLGLNTIGIGIPGCISKETGLIKNANSICLIGKPLREDLTQRLRRPIAIANDADCFTLSEASDGAGVKYSNVFGIILGTGVGGGISINKTIINGPNAITGEWGHNPLPWLTEQDYATPCYCGKEACIETFLSGPGISKQFERLSLMGSDTALTLKSEEIFQLSQSGHSLALKCVDQYIDQLARSLASVINILDPDAIVFGGGLSNIDNLYPKVHLKLHDYIFSDTVNTKLMKAQHGDSSGVRGAAWLGACPRTST